MTKSHARAPARQSGGKVAFMDRASGPRVELAAPLGLAL